jgi:phosphatidylethanolamine-binding protein (PEBP) family uncharacterized protein
MWMVSMVKFLLSLVIALIWCAQAQAVETGWWANNDEPGRGYTIEVQNGTLFIGGYMYDDSGNAVWYISIGPMTDSLTYSGTWAEVGNGQTLTGAFKAASYINSNVGSLSMKFSDSRNATLTLPTGRQISITRFSFGPTTNAITNPIPIEGGWWSYSAEPGRGFSLEVQNGSLFMAGYMYDTSGQPIWYITGPSNMTDSSTYTGTWKQVGNGQTLTGAFKAAAYVNSNVGSVSLKFSSAKAATLTLPDNRQIPLTRFTFGTPPTSFTLTSSAGGDGDLMSSSFTCDGMGSSPPLSWSNAPTGTKEFAVLMSTLPGDGTTKYNWVLYGIPAGVTSLNQDNFGIGTNGAGNDGPYLGYQPPCSQGPGAKTYTFTVYALSASPTLPAQSSVTGATLASAIANITLGKSSLNFSYSRATTATGSTTNCGYVLSSLKSSTTGAASAGCDANYAYISSNGIPTHTMMNGIIATNLQVPTAQNFQGTNAWRIPLKPALASSTTTAVDGPIGVAVNGVPIFNPCKQGGCSAPGGGDTKAVGELDICNGHAGRADDYHYHAAPTCLMAGQSSNYWNTHPVGWALDGFAIFGYNDATGTVATRDSICGGNTSAVSNAPSGYSYHVTDTSPYILSCFRGTPSPDLLGQGSKYSPMRQPPVTPFAVSNMTLATDSSDGYQVLQFTSAAAFTATETGQDSYANAAGTYKIRYKQLTGTDLTTQLALKANVGKTACWNFQFLGPTGSTSQPTVSYCR